MEALNFHTLLPILALLCNILLFFLILQKTRRAELKIPFLAFLVGNILWNIGSILMRWNPTETQALVGARIISAGITAVAVSYYLFISYYLKKENLAFRILAVSSLLVFLVLDLGTSYAISGLFRNIRGYVGKPGLLWSPLIVIVYSWMIYAIFLLIKDYRKTQEPFKKNRHKYLLLGISIYFLGGLFDYLTTLGIPIYPFGIVGQTINTLFIFFAIVKYHLLDIRIIIQKGLIYSILTGCVTGIYLLLVSAMGLVFGEYWYRNTSLSLLAFALAAVCIALVFQPAKDYLQLYVDRVFFRNRTDYARSLKNFTEDITGIQEIESLLKTICRGLCDTLNAEKVFISICREDDRPLIYSTEDNHHTRTPLFSERLKGWLLKRGYSILPLDEEFVPYLKEIFGDEYHFIKEQNLLLLIPLRMEDNFLGLIGVGPHKSGEMYSLKDVEIGKLIADESVIAIENSFLYEKVRRDAEESRLLYEFSQELYAAVFQREVFLLAVRAASQLLSADEVYIWLLQKNSKTFELMAAFPPFITPHQTPLGMRYEHPLMQSLIQDKKCISLDASSGLTSDVHSGIMVPLLIKNKVAGLFLACYRSAAVASDDNRIKMLSLLAYQVALALEKTGLYDELMREHNLTEQLLGETLKAQESERRRLALEIHDTIAQGMVSAFTQVQTCRRLLKRGDETVEKELLEAQQMIQNNLREIRNFILDLRPSNLEELGLLSTVSYACMSFESNTGIRVNFNADELTASLSSNIENALYRIIQEALSNIKKHSAAHNAIVNLKNSEDFVILLIKDDGVGFDPEKVLQSSEKNRHFGLLGIKERTYFIEGEVELLAGPGAGTAMTIKIPLHRV